MLRLWPLLLLCSCATLSTGWAKIDFLTAPTDMMVCSFKIDSEGDTTGKCADWNDVNEGLHASGWQQRVILNKR